ncbi:MAG: hypothetical protein IPI67_09585 [Myxococcales bacterium]|nr:hypothetical protein [Myxococcales bacterium]
MNDPKRLTDRFQPGLARELLVLAQDERAPEGAQARVEARVLAALAATAATAATTTAIGASTSGASLANGGTSLALVVVKWLSVGALVGSVAGLGGAGLVASWDTPTEREADSALATSTGSAEVAAARESGAPLIPPPPALPQVTKTNGPPESADSGAARTSADSRAARGDVKIGPPSTVVRPGAAPRPGSSPTEDQRGDDAAKTEIKTGAPQHQ